MKKPKTYYDFDYMEEYLKEVLPEFKHADTIENTIRMFPSAMFLYVDLDPEKTGAWWNGKKIVPEHDLDKEREEFIKYLIKKYKVEE